VTIPASVRHALALHAGDKVAFVEREQGQFVMVVTDRSLLSLKGMFGKSIKVVSIEEMNCSVSGRGSSS